MTNEMAIQVVEEIVCENRENGELEGILNRYRITALKRLLSLAQVGIHTASGGRRNGKRSRVGVSPSTKKKNAQPDQPRSGL